MSECGRLSAVNTNCCEFVHFFGKRDQVNNVSERFSLESAIEGSNNDNNSSIGKFLSKLDNILEELSLINANDIILDGFTFYIVQFGGFKGLVGDSEFKIKLLVMSGHNVFA